MAYTLREGCLMTTEQLQKVCDARDILKREALYMCAGPPEPPFREKVEEALQVAIAFLDALLYAPDEVQAELQRRVDLREEQEDRAIERAMGVFCDGMAGQGLTRVERIAKRHAQISPGDTQMGCPPLGKW